MAKLSAYGGHEVARYKGTNGFVMVLVENPRGARLLVKYTASDGFHVVQMWQLGQMASARAEFDRREATYRAADGNQGERP